MTSLLFRILINIKSIVFYYSWVKFEFSSANQFRKKRTLLHGAKLAFENLSIFLNKKYAPH